MTLLQVMPHDAPAETTLRTTDRATITETLGAHGITLTTWPLRALTPGADTDTILEHYRPEIDQLRTQEGYTVVDAVALHPEHGPDWQERADKARATFLDEHRHAEDEVRFFAHGTGCFYLHLDTTVHAVVCEAGDLLSVPAGTRHWFDMGPRPDFAAIRFFKEKDGWVGDFTGDPISQHFPRLDALLAPGR